jgi:multidrug efflux pump subunit AcrA (membrane-fusion protein)
MLVALGILGLGFALMSLFASLREETPKQEPELRRIVVNAEKVRRGEVAAEIVAYGRLKSAQPVVINSEVNGTLQHGDINFRPGQRFTRGQLLIKVDTRQIELDISSAKSELLQALASVLPEIRVDFPDEYDVWQQYFNRCSFDRPVPRLPEAANNNIKLYLSRFKVYTIYFSIRDLEITHEKHFMRAPFDGAVVSADLRPGSNVRSGTRIGEIISLEELEMVVPVTVGDVQWIEPDKPVVLTSAELRGKWQGRIKRIGKTIDQQTQTVQAYILVDEAEELYDGIFLKAAIPGRAVQEAVRFPRRALYREKYVYLIEDGVLVFRPVEVVRSETDYVIVDGGLADNDMLVTDVLQGVSPGMPAVVKNSDERSQEMP